MTAALQRTVGAQFMGLSVSQRGGIPRFRLRRPYLRRSPAPVVREMCFRLVYHRMPAEIVGGAAHRAPSTSQVRRLPSGYALGERRQRPPARPGAPAAASFAPLAARVRATAGDRRRQGRSPRAPVTYSAGDARARFSPRLGGGCPLGSAETRRKRSFSGPAAPKPPLRRFSTGALAAHSQPVYRDVAIVITNEAGAQIALPLQQVHQQGGIAGAGRTYSSLCERIIYINSSRIFFTLSRSLAWQGSTLTCGGRRSARRNSSGDQALGLSCLLAAIT